MFGKLYVILLLLPMAAVIPDGSVPDGFQHWSQADLTTKGKTLNLQAGSDPGRVVIQKLADYDHEYFLLVHRNGDGTPEWHETETDLFAIQSGSATLIVGGTLQGGNQVSAHEKRGGTIQGGTTQMVSAGDVVRIPARVAHQLNADAGQDLVYFVVKIKGY